MVSQTALRVVRSNSCKCAENNTYVYEARQTIIALCDLYCHFPPQCEALRAYRPQQNTKWQFKRTRIPPGSGTFQPTWQIVSSFCSEGTP